MLSCNRLLVRFAAAFALLAALGSVPAGASPDPVPSIPLSAEAARPVLDRLRQGVKNLTSLRCDFTQEKRLAVFSQTLVSRGTLSFRKPDSLRWEYVSPVRSGFVVNGGKGAAWSAAGGEMHKSDLRDSREFAILAEQIALWLAFDEDAISRQYTLEVLSASPAILRLTPKNDGVRRFLRGLILIFAPDDSTAEEVRILEGDNGDSTILRFSNAVRNEALPDALFKP